MASGCVSGVAGDLRQPTRVTYRSLHRWPESDMKFVKSVTSKGDGGSRCPPVVDSSYSCRQMYLRTYTFSKEDAVPVKTIKFLRKKKEEMVRKAYSKMESRKRHQVTRKMKWCSCPPVLSNFFKRLLSCTTNVRGCEQMIEF